jgi:apolipoprotein D and lipocalin family protein
MRTAIRGGLVGAGLLALAACASTEGGSGAPQPLKPVDAARFYSGVWREIGRRPMSLTDGCVAGATEYVRKGGDEVTVLDSCHAGTPDGKLKTIGGPARILDPGTNAKLHVSYRLFGFLTIPRDYWVLDHDEAYTWFISADPTFHDLWIYTRNPAVSADERAKLVERARALGYDVTKLEFPAQPAS